MLLKDVHSRDHVVEAILALPLAQRCELCRLVLSVGSDALGRQSVKALGVDFVKARDLERVRVSVASGVRSQEFRGSDSQSINPFIHP